MRNNIFGRIRRSATLFKRSNGRYYRMNMVKPPYWISIGGKETRVFCEDIEGCHFVYHELIINDVYDFFDSLWKFKARIIVDIGAHVGMFSKLCSLAFPEAVIYAYEPNPDSFKWLKQNCEGTLITPFEKAVLGRGGAVLHA